MRSELQRHHIIPKHFCDDVNCLGYKSRRKHTCFIGEDVNLTKPIPTIKHAERHKELWAIYGKDEDFIAWQALSGLMGSEEARIAAVRASGTLFQTGHESYWRGKKNPNITGKNNPMANPIVVKKVISRRPQIQLHMIGDLNPMKRPEVADKFRGDKNPMRRSEIADKFRGEKNPMKRQDIRDKVSVAQRGIKQQTIECPNCHKIGGICLMKRYHFNRCKNANT